MRRKKVFLIGSLLFLCAASNLFSTEVENPIEARTLVVDRLLESHTAGRRISVHPDLLDPGETIASWRGPVLTTESAGYVVFVDDLAYANFAHPCRYVFVDRSTGCMTIEEALTPPLDPTGWIEMETEAWTRLSKVKNIRPHRPAVKSPPRKNGRGGELYAVLISGGYIQPYNYPRYWNDLANIYVTLVDVYGYDEENITVFCSDGLDPAADQSDGSNSDPDLDGDGDADIDAPCDFASIDNFFYWFKYTIQPDDQLFVFTTDHGNRLTGWDAYMNLWNYDYLSDEQLADMVDALPQCDMIFTLEQCFSGGFEDDLCNTSNRVFSSACAHDEYSWALPPNYEYDAYVFFWTAAVRGEDAYGTTVDADLDGDGAVSVSEAFVYAASEDAENETPQYCSEPQNLGETLFLGETPSEFVVNADGTGDFTRIQNAIDAAQGGSTIRVAAGVYNEQIDFTGKNLTVRSERGASETVIDGEQAGSVVTFANGEGPGALLQGFTIRNGSGSYTVQSGKLGGGIIAANGAAPRLDANVIRDNSADSGAGLFCASSSPQITNTIFVNNNAVGLGGGIYFGAGSQAVAVNNTVLKNSAGERGGGIYSAPTSAPRVSNSIVRQNEAPNGPEIRNKGLLSVTYSNVAGGWTGTGNIDADPLFADETGWDFHLTWASPCRDSGDDTVVGLPDRDNEGDPRIEGDRVDMGADEVHPHLYRIGATLPGGTVDICVVGAPGQPALQALGAKILDPPFETPHGFLYIWPIVNYRPLGNIPLSGILVAPTTVPSTWVPGDEYPYQALIGAWGDPSTILSNLMIVVVE